MSLRYVIARIVTTAVLALSATLVVFAVAHFVPADPIMAQLGDRASADPEIVATYRARWGLDKSLPEQYVTFLWNLAHGDAGVSIKSRRPVLADLTQYAPATFELATFAAIIAIVV